MIKIPDFNLTHHICKGFAAFCIILALSVATTPAAAEVISINPSDPPEIILPPEDAQRLQELQKVVSPWLITALSPNGKYVLTSDQDAGVAILNVHTGHKVVASSDIYEFNPVTELRWMNNRTLITIAENSEGELHLLRMHRRSGEMTSTPIDLPGSPISLSNKANKVVLARPIEAAVQSKERGALPQDRPSPIERVELPKRLNPREPEIFDYERRSTVPVATARVATVLYDLTTGKETPLIEIEMDTALYATEWSPRDHQLAIIRGLTVDGSRSGQVSEDSPEVQDALGNLSPEENPYLTQNTLDLFQIRSDGVQHREIHPEAGDRAVFRNVAWDPYGLIFVAQMWTAGTPEGRSHPTYTHPNGSTYRFYLFNGQMINTLDQPETEALYGQAHMISPFEVLIHAPHKLDFCVFEYNLYTRKLKRLATPAGSVHQIKVSPWRKQMVYQFSSYHQPNELFRQKLNKDTPVQITHYNDHARDLNRIRADEVQFALANGAKRTGYLIQPADGAFPPDNIPLVVWQEGGPTAPITQQWGSIVELPFNILPNFGMAVLVVPLPGRDGFGRDFLDGLAGGTNFGQIDINEQAEIIDQLAAWGYTSWDRTGVTGCSYGGYFASQSVTSPGTAYAAANPQCSLLDLFDEWDMGYTNLIAYLMGQAPNHLDEYHRDSPLSRSASVETPTLIFSGTEDFLPSEFSREFHDSINAAGTPADYYEFIGEPHGLYQPSSQFVAGQAQIAWFRDYLLR